MTKSVSDIYTLGVIWTKHLFIFLVIPEDGVVTSWKAPLAWFPPPPVWVDRHLAEAGQSQCSPCIYKTGRHCPRNKVVSKVGRWLSSWRTGTATSRSPACARPRHSWLCRWSLRCTDRLGPLVASPRGRLLGCRLWGDCGCWRSDQSIGRDTPGSSPTGRRVLQSTSACRNVSYTLQILKRQVKIR